jgi:hypothetical protein
MPYPLKGTWLETGTYILEAVLAVSQPARLRHLGLSWDRNSNARDARCLFAVPERPSEQCTSGRTNERDDHNEIYIAAYQS